MCTQVERFKVLCPKNYLQGLSKFSSPYLDFLLSMATLSNYTICFTNA